VAEQVRLRKGVMTLRFKGRRTAAIRPRGVIYVADPTRDSWPYPTDGSNLVDGASNARVICL
jgi:hypothetical protein